MKLIFLKPMLIQMIDLLQLKRGLLQRKTPVLLVFFFELVVLFVFLRLIVVILYFGSEELLFSLVLKLVVVVKPRWYLAVPAVVVPAVVLTFVAVD